MPPSPGSHNSTPMTSPVITVILIRHGERVDEVESYDNDDSRRSLKECIDPHLTSRGHQQAAEAFSRLVPILRGKRVAFFVSPMRRTIATSLSMIGSCDMTGIEIIPIPTTTQKLTSIPWIVMNGLSDCAANVRYLGGASVVVQHGLIDGAAMVANEWDPSVTSSNKTTPFQRMLSEMPLLQNLPNTVQYFKTNDGKSFIPMSGPIGQDRSTSNSSASQTTPTSTTPSASTTIPQTIINDDSFITTMDNIVKISAAFHCSVCLVVTHREAIRDMVRRFHPDPRLRIATPYCCVGHFSARISNESSVDWNVHAVLPYEHIGGG
jgi:hypothetical protein